MNYYLFEGNPLSAAEAFEAYLENAPQSVQSAAYMVGDEVTRHFNAADPELAVCEQWDKIAREIYQYQTMRAAMEAIEAAAMNLGRLSDAKKSRISKMLAAFAINEAKEVMSL